MRISNGTNQPRFGVMQQTAVTTLSTALRSSTDWSLNPISLAEWAAVWSPFSEMRALHPLNEDGTNLWSAIVRQPLAGARYATGHQLLKNQRRHSPTQGDLLAIQLVASGTASMAFEARKFVQRPGALSIVDIAQPFQGSHHNTVGEMIFVRKELLGLSQEDSIDPILLTTDTLQGQLLATEVRRFFELDVSENGVAYEPTTLFHLLISIISHHRHPSSDRVDWWRARNKLIRDHIEENLGDLNLLPAQICNLFNLSRATLYRMFESDGGVRRYIQDRRLHAAVWDLAEGGIHRGRLTEVAEKWGFSSNANFNRAVKIVFGMPPGALFRPPSVVVPARLSSHKDKFPVFDWLTNSDTRGEPGTGTNQL